MIQASELILGNYVNDEFGYSIKVESIFDIGINCYEDDDGNWAEIAKHFISAEYPFDKIFPIVITEEVLLKVGFKQDKDWDIKCFIIKHNNINIFFEKHSSGWSLSLPGLASVMVEHLHKAQNLIFILTGKELKIEL